MSAIFDWATSDNLQPEPVTLEIWRKLSEDYCRQVEVVNGDIVRAESPNRAHQKAARRLADLVEAAALAHVNRWGGCLDVDTDFDVVLWEFPRVTIRRPDVALFDCAPNDLRPLPASLVKIAIEVISPGTEMVDSADKKTEYALAGIPWYWLVWVSDNSVSMIKIFVLDHVQGQYVPHLELQPADGDSVIEAPVRCQIDWKRLSDLVL
ncbi:MULTISPECIES: Uma2 family endonuclease [Nocardia]|uniref:Uma2 family endonuclease n=2 Tax=Nocardia TaxID=1817 RepID=A0A846W7L1_9NOCA|nr:MULTISPECIES: Uma2 family endonuclease [Nocardia]NKX88448.1 Uma2 family endonuclease [Nocardia coubleae]TDP42304.1 putative restriction endonuclease [Nocardia ignorata]